MRKYLLVTTLLCPLAAQAQMLGSYTSNTTDLNNLTAAVGPMSMQGVYVDSSMQSSDWVRSAQYAASSIVATCPPASCQPLIGLPMGGARQNADAQFKQIASGALDNVILGELKAFSAQGYQQMTIRPGFEMNGAFGWNSAWNVNASNAADFIAAFQRIATLAHNFSDALVSVNFNPAAGASPIPLQNYFPGKPYVDSVGLDLYGAGWQSPYAPNDPGSSTNLTFKSVAAFAKEQGLPFSLTETGSATGDTIFPQQLALAIQSTGTSILFAGLWNNDGSGPATFTNNAAATAAWAQLAAVIKRSIPPGGLPLVVPQSAAASTAVGLAIASGVDPLTAAASAADAGAALPPELTIDQIAAIATSVPSTPVVVPDIASIAAIAQSAAPLVAGPDGQYTPPVPPSAPATPLSITDEFGLLVDNSGAHSIAVAGSGNVVCATGGPETVDVTGHGSSIRTGLFNDTITLHTHGNTVDGGGGEDTVVLDYPLAGAVPASPLTLATAGLSKAGNTIVAPPPGQGVLTIQGMLGPNDEINVARSLAGTLWDGTAATVGQYLTVQRTAKGATLSVNGKIVVVLTTMPQGGIGQYITAGGV